jgi:broad specificity phosphatase PhoE
LSFQLVLISHASTAAVARAAFPLDEELDPRGRVRAADAAPRLGRFDAAWCGPSRRTVETAAILGVDAVIDPELRDCDYGAWAGRTLGELEAEQPEALARWLSDPAAAPHGGESLDALLARVGGWLDRHRDDRGTGVAVTHAAVIRAAIVRALGAAPKTFWRVDIAPLSRTMLVANDDRWNVRTAGAEL